MTKKTLGLVLCLTTTLSIQAQSLSPERLLPSDTLLMATLPNVKQAKADGEFSLVTRLFSDPAMAPFVEKFKRQCTAKLIAPLEKELDVKFSDYADLIEGQATFAVVKNGASASNGKKPTGFLILDSGSNAERLKGELTKLKQRWQSAGKEIQSENFRGVEFHTVKFNTKDLDAAMKRAFPNASKAEDAEDKGETVKFTFGQSGSLLLVGGSAQSFEKILVKQAGGLTPILGEYLPFEQDFQAQFRNATGYGWFNAKAFMEMVMPLIEQGMAASQAKSPMPGLSAKLIVDALGLNAVKTASASMSSRKDGEYIHMSLSAPASARKGLIKLFEPMAADSAPPAFVPGNAAAFSRYRIEMKEIWTKVEAMITEISPQMAPMINMIVGMAGKDQDPNFDLKRDVIGNLGNDVITYALPPRGKDVEDLIQPPTLTLFQTPQPEKLASSMKTVSRLFPGGVQSVKDREFLGRKLYTLELPPMPSLDGSQPTPKGVYFAASGSYVAVSTDITIIENYLRGNTSSGGGLAGLPGLQEAAAKVGGMNTGYFYYEDPTENMKVAFEYLRNNPDAFEELFSGNMAGVKGLEFWDAEKRKEWIDFTLLPPFDQISKYIGITVAAVDGTDRGIEFKVYSPTPPSVQ